MYKSCGIFSVRFHYISSMPWGPWARCNISDVSYFINQSLSHSQTTQHIQLQHFIVKSWTSFINQLRRNYTILRTIYLCLSLSANCSCYPMCKMQSFHDVVEKGWLQNVNGRYVLEHCNVRNTLGWNIVERQQCHENRWLQNINEK